jgi:hypothetical protein
MPASDYFIDIGDPFAKSIAAFRGGYGDVETLRRFDEERQERQRVAQERQSGMDALQNLARLGNNATSGDYMSALAANPTFSQPIGAMQKTFGAERSANELRFGQQLFSVLAEDNIDLSKQMLDERIAAYRNAGDNRAADSAQAIRLMLDKPGGLGAARASVGMTLANGMGGPEFKAFFEQFYPQQEPVKPNQVQSSQILSDGKTAVVVYKNGQVAVVDTSTDKRLTGEAARAALKEAQEQQIKTAGGRERVVAQAKAAVKAGADAFSQLANIEKSIKNLDEVIGLVEKQGASTGVIASQLPNWSDAAVQLENMRANLGLDVINSVTFGALSQSELDLALATGLPTKLSGSELIKWVKNKKESQQKLAKYLKEQARFLLNGYGGVGDWIDYSEKKKINPGLTIERWQRGDFKVGSEGNGPRPTITYDQSGNRIP